ncbi:hypothetical protein MRB53_004501 [Persea americana]|uniref:Uncharacterized protein n=1 Tax=Persea americana TaxID=3435 RepID=A0ACC2MBD9_PERAE|nr:hypothetical protein MRB53_004501 [Persea americana]
MSSSLPERNLVSAVDMFAIVVLWAILSAWKEACAWDGMGRILIPKETFIVGPLTPSRVKIDNVSFKNIRGTSSSQVAVNLLCSKGIPCQNVKLIDINLAYNVQGVAATAACANVKGTSSGLQSPPSCI